jgi:hypothetical protein
MAACRCPFALRRFAVTIAPMENHAPPTPGFRKLPARYATIVLPLFLSCIMTCLISAISTLRGVGFAPGVLQLWLGSWGVSWLIAFPTLMAVLPFVRRLTGKVVEMP